MAGKSAASLDALVLLGVEKLAQVILDEAETNPSFRKRVTAALASTKGPDAVAKLIDRRLAGAGTGAGHDRGRGNGHPVPNSNWLNWIERIFFGQIGCGVI